MYKDNKKLTIAYDGSFDITTGRSRKETKWKNQQMTWNELVDKLRFTHRTAETYLEFLSAKKSRQDEIKDIGGFVGGYISGGRRLKGSILHRQVITLDVDNASKDLWEDFHLLYGSAAVLYTSHKHSAEAPRYRLVIPLDRPVFPEEYMAISRRIAGVLGIEQFDHTTYQPERLMYWPSAARDGDTDFQFNDAPWLSADSILNTYRDWRDTSEWPMSDGETDLIFKSIEKQGDPLEKSGIVGAFCRTYTISEVIENFLPNVYESCDVDNRYTYKGGSTAAGLVVYDDKFAFSHHATDPISGKLCNAFDLVRIHRFGLKDEEAKEGTPVHKLPSHIAMEEFAKGDKKVVLQISNEKIQNSREDFADSLEEEEDDSWKSKMQIDRKGNFLSTINNVFNFLQNHPAIKGRLFLNEFEGRIYVKRDLPWRKVTDQSRDFTDDDIDCLAKFMEENSMPFSHLQKALANVRNANTFHPVRDYLQSLKWDGEERVEKLFIEYLGSEDNEYHRAVARIMLVAAVARVIKPGIKFDTVITLVGKQGIGKSTLISRLARSWFSDCLGDIHTKEGMESLRGVWIMEIAELASFRKADLEAIKRFITSTEDVYRPAYGRQQVRHPRQCIFVATTNREDFLNSADGNRRFLPVVTNQEAATMHAFTDLGQEEVDQLWAEAYLYFKSGESLVLPESMRSYVEQLREDHSEQDPKAGIIEEYLEKLLPENWYDLGVYDRRSFISNEDALNPGAIQRERVCVAEIWCEALGGVTKDMTAHNTKFIHNILRKLKGWEEETTKRRFYPYGIQRSYRRKKSVAALSKSVAALGQNVAALGSKNSKTVAAVAANVAAN